jgi:hypothetical protein
MIELFASTGSGRAGTDGKFMMATRSAALAATISLCVLGTICTDAQVVTGSLVLYLDANSDTNGVDGWDYTQPGFGGGSGTLPVFNAGSAPGNFATAQGGRYFHSADSGQFFGGTISPQVDMAGDFTWEIWLRSSSQTHADNQVAGWRRDVAFNSTFSNIGMDLNNSTDDFSVDWELQDFDTPPEVEEHADLASIGAGEWHQVVCTYQDASGEESANGVLSVYMDGNPTPINVLANQTPHLRGQPPLFTSKMGYASVFSINPADFVRNFLGDIAIVRLYRDLLTPAEITQNFNAHTNSYEIGPIPPIVPVPTNIAAAAEFEIETVDGEYYELERSSDLTAGPAAWGSTGALILGDGGTLRMYDPADPGGPGYHRVRFSTP